MTQGVPKQEKRRTCTHDDHGDIACDENVRWHTTRVPLSVVVGATASKRRRTDSMSTPQGVSAVESKCHDTVIHDKLLFHQCNQTSFLPAEKKYFQLTDAMPKLKYGEKIEINKHKECEDLRESIMLLAEQLPAKIQGIDETRRLQWIKTALGNLLKEKKQVLTKHGVEASRKRALDYYHKNREAVLKRLNAREVR